ncbi:MAG TPA: hypothetical protein V6D10_02060 [Trichocoleus sp.]|jgi:hypothetical protein
MPLLQKPDLDLNQRQQTIAVSPQSLDSDSIRKFSFKKLRGGLLIVVGFLLSPLSWWNDLIFNLPVAYLFGYLCHLIHSDWFIPATIAGYWLSNVLGVLLMQAGIIDVAQEQDKERNFKQELMTGLISSTAYTLVILALVRLNIFNTPDLFSDEAFAGFRSLLPW